MTKKNVLQDFVNYSISQSESDTVKGGRANNPINTGSFGFIDWGDVEIRNPGFVVTANTAASIEMKKFGS